MSAKSRSEYPGLEELYGRAFQAPEFGPVPPAIRWGGKELALFTLAQIIFARRVVLGRSIRSGHRVIPYIRSATQVDRQP